MGKYLCMSKTSKQCLCGEFSTRHDLAAQWQRQIWISCIMCCTVGQVGQWGHKPHVRRQIVLGSCLRGLDEAGLPRVPARISRDQGHCTSSWNDQHPQLMLSVPETFVQVSRVQHNHAPPVLRYSVWRQKLGGRRVRAPCPCGCLLHRACEGCPSVY